VGPTSGCVWDINDEVEHGLHVRISLNCSSRLTVGMCMRLEMMSRRSIQGSFGRTRKDRNGGIHGQDLQGYCFLHSTGYATKSTIGIPCFALIQRCDANLYAMITCAATRYRRFTVPSYQFESNRSSPQRKMCSATGWYRNQRQPYETVAVLRALCNYF
jgi:hypothetical protein